MANRIALVIRGINNIYTLQFPDGAQTLSRIKGKTLAHTQGQYNPLAVGDKVQVSDDGQILLRLERSSSFSRWNIKGLSNQTLAANMQQILVVASVLNPPFRPRFIDRALACSEHADIVICLTKCDLGLLSPQEEDRVAYYQKLGYQVVRTSSHSGHGLSTLKTLIQGKTTALVGQSGVGKSTLVNLLCGSNQKTNTISDKYDRGRHTTNHSLMLMGNGFSLIDTPGVRELYPPHGDPHAIASSFPEFRGAGCLYDGCLHHGEKGCKVQEMVARGEIPADRYESYLHMLDSLEEMAPKWVTIEKKRPLRKGVKYREFHGFAE